MRRRFQRIACAFLALWLLCAAGCGLTRETAPDFSGEAEPLSVGSPVKHHFALLDETEKHAYNAILSVIYTFPERIAVPTLTQPQLDRIYTALLSDNPDLFFLDRRSTVRQNKQWANFIPQYVMAKEDYEAMLRKCEKVASGILEEAESAQTEFDREKVVHDRLIDMCVYSDSDAYSYKSTIYGALCGGSAACEGYAKTAKYLLDRLGIPCYVVTGVSTPPGSASSSHMWNIVQLDGEYYHLDLTWDDPVLENGGNLIHYTYFNVTDNVIAKTHSGFTGTDACTAIEQNYFIHRHLLFADWGEAEQERTQEIAAETIQAGSEGFQLRFGNRDAFEKAKQDLFDEQGVYPILQKIREQTEKEFAVDRVSYLYDADDLTIDVILDK